MDLDLGLVHLYDVGTLASWIAASISAVATGATLWLRRRDRPEANFYLESAALVLGPAGRNSIRQSFGSDRDHDECLSLTNIGDGAAHGVIVTSRGCRVRPMIMDTDDKRGYQSPLVLAKLEPGDSCMLVIWNDFGVLPEEVFFYVEWLNVPTRHNKRMKQKFCRTDVFTVYPGEERYAEQAPARRGGELGSRLKGLTSRSGQSLGHVFRRGK